MSLKHHRTETWKKSHFDHVVSQLTAAEILGISPDTLRRMAKRGQTRQTTLKKLADALRVDPADLTGPVPDDQVSIPAWEPNKSQLNLRISDQARNALLLVSERYHVRPAQIVELAPLLFYWAAEKCLAQRQERFEILRKRQAGIVEELENFASDVSSLDRSGPPWNAIDLAKFDEEFNQFCVDEEAGMYFRCLFDEYGLGGPIENFLTDLVSEVEGHSEFGGWRPDSSPTYNICKEEAAWLANGDEVALENILQGYAPLHDLPNEFWEQLRTRNTYRLGESDTNEANRQRQGAERVKWLRAHGKPVGDDPSEVVS